MRLLSKRRSANPSRLAAGLGWDRPLYSPVMHRFAFAAWVAMKSMSGGERQLCALARIRDGGLALLDEPFANLDAAAAQNLASQLRNRVLGSVMIAIPSMIKEW